MGRVKRKKLTVADAGKKTDEMKVFWAFLNLQFTLF